MHTPEDLRTKDRFVNRRKMAWRSFYAFSVLGTALVLLGLWDPDRVIAIWPQAMGIMGLWGTVVAAYFGSAWSNDNTELKKHG